MTSKFDLVPPEFLVIPPSHADDAGRQQEVEPPRLLGAAVDLHKGREHVDGKEDPNSKQDFVELSLDTNSEGPPDLPRSPAGPDGQRRRNRTDTMIFSEAVNIAEDLAKVQTEGELEGSTSFTDVPPLEEVTQVPLSSEVAHPTGDMASALSDPSPEFNDHIPADEVEEIPLPAVTDSEPVPEDSGEESSDEEVVPEEEIPDPAVAEPPVPSDTPVSEPPSTSATEPSPSETIPDDKKPEPADVPEQTQSIPEVSEPPVKIEVTLATTDEDEDVEKNEEEPTSDPGPSPHEANDDGDGSDDDDDGEDDEDDGSQPANQPEVKS